MKKLCVILLAVFLSGCASLENRYKSIIFDDGVNQSEARTVAQYHITQHPLNKEFKKKPNRIINDGGNVWPFYFNSRDQFDYVFRVDIERSSGKIVRSGLIPKEKSHFEIALTNFISFFAEGDFVVLGLVTRFYEENSHWPTNDEEMKAWLEVKSKQGSNQNVLDGFNKDALSQVEILHSTPKQIELKLPLSAAEKGYVKYLYDPNLIKKRRIIIFHGDGPKNYQFQYPDVNDMVLTFHVSSSSTMDVTQ